MVMRKWCATAAATAIFVFPLNAQQKNARVEDGQVASNETAEKSKSASRAANEVPALSSSSAFPATPKRSRAAAGSSSGDSSAPGRAYPRYEGAGMYDYTVFHPGAPFSSFGNHGGSGSFDYNATSWLGLGGEIGGFHYQRNVGGVRSSGNLTSYLFGPRLSLRRFDYFV